MPRYRYFKVYNEGTLEVGEGRTWPPSENGKDIHHATRKLSKDDLRKIERIIDRNYKILSMQQKDLEEFVPCLDGTFETFIISDGEQKASFVIPDLFLTNITDYEEYDPDKSLTPKHDLILHIHALIRKILIENYGLNAEMF